MTFIENSKWFYKESKKYLGKFGLKEKLYFPIAYIKFMWLTYANG